MHSTLVALGLAVVLDFANAAKISKSSADTTCCSSKLVASLASALSTYAPADSFCSSLYPESVHDTVTDYTYTSTVISVTTTSTFCVASTGNAKRSPSSIASTVESSAVPKSTLKSSVPKSSASSSEKATSTHVTEAPSSTLVDSSAYSQLTGLPSSCISSVCSDIAGEKTIYPTYTGTFSTLVATVYAPQPEVCGSNDYCDTSHTAGPVCRPDPGVNTCHPGPITSGDPYLIDCESTNGCSGVCAYPPPNGPANLTGVCIDFVSADDYPNNLVTPCTTDSDCGRGELCAQGARYASGGSATNCLLAASETCGNANAPERLFRLKKKSFRG